ncbi:hypothetical protein DEI93_14965 [Curtobacterium sp. MCBD17_035]|uniref:hypothetical protein n=1 Tax=Curtobacterium sp. MCBD17_035 TaxID=2175673 RepID=UPI000DA9F68E|nr:hypothetical protein [Curtobacterium sp. MCBD17_035]WIB67237.1 hypothetical protein DEI93_14965 [Curtobacterium sp. MCBD17_035]
MLERFRNLPIWALAVVMFVVLVVVRGGIDLVDPPRHTDWPAQLIGDAVYAVLLTALLSVRVSIARRRAGGTSALSAMRRSLNTGQVPDDADPSTWTPMLERWERQQRRSAWLAPVLCAVLALVSVWLLTQFADPIGIALVVLWVALGIWSVVQTRRVLPRIRRMLDTLRARGSAWTYPADAPTGGTAPAQPQAGAPSPH